MFGRLVRIWWREPVDYAAQVQYFAKRSMAEAIQVMIGVGTALIAVISLVIQPPWAAADGLASRMAVASFAVLTLFWATAWCCRPWPSRPMSVGFVVSCDGGIALAALQDPAWLPGLFGFNAFALISVYLLFFDGPKLLALHTMWILVSTTVFAVQVAPDARIDATVFAANTLAAVAPMVATPLGIQFGIWTLRNDANDAVTDPLTGLLNRRGLLLHFGELLRDHHGLAAHLAVMIVDLDRFKHINDAFGHAVGDDVLIRSARRIESAVCGSALVARFGGEEFVIINVVEPGLMLQTTERIRTTIARPGDHAPVTASVGVTNVALANFAAPQADRMAMLDSLIVRADHAMLHAKRKGGNTTIHTGDVDWDIRSV